jgi:hypothetical protein
MDSVCEECRDLWRQYSVATATHIQLENKLRLAALHNELSLIETLTVETEGAEKSRGKLRELIHQHEDSHSITAARARIRGGRFALYYSESAGQQLEAQCAALRSGREIAALTRR